MTEKRFTYRFNKQDEGEFEIIDLSDDAYYGMDTTENCVKELVDLLNSQEERIKELETRNKRQYERLKKITDLIFNKNWEALELIVEDWEESNGLLQAEYGNCGDV